MADAEHQWCAGLRIKQARVLTASEMDAIWSRRRSTIAKAWAWLLGIPVVLILFMTLIASPSPPQESFLAIGMVVFVLLGIFLGIPVCIAIANDYFKRASALKRQYRDSEVLVCQGKVEDIVARRSELKRILRETADSSEAVLEVLAQSGLVWTINGRPQESWLIASRTRTAKSPEQARLAAQYVKPVETEDGVFRLHQRALSEEECSELLGYLPRIALAAWGLVLLLNGAAAYHVVLYTYNPTYVPLVGVVMLVGAACCNAQLVLAIRNRRRILRDVSDGFVVIYQPDPGVMASEASVVEFLPHSAAEWTRGGAPQRGGDCMAGFCGRITPARRGRAEGWR